ncbi:MAG: flagellar basal body P-ring protein FlgI [Phycisphaeraceae bacterium]|nr:flagellar basal body P-ring protein FlgI [Phycisphaeraceae bacterium]MBX3367293.1 flagellar basal body P-ring protein FlgI [Phycisphaeraceae bacterium]
MPQLARFSLFFATLALLAAFVLPLGGCGGSKKEPPRARTVAPVVRNVPASLRGTIGSEVTINGVQPVVVSGLGLVVGLNGTGGLALDSGVAATMERELGLRGISQGGNTTAGTNVAGMSPRELLADPNTAVVTVYAAIPPGSPKGATFDVYLRALNATSLEGGMLWTTDMRIGDPTVIGGYRTQKLASARGPVFVNPFVDPGSATTGVGQAVGRVLDGGFVDSPLKLELQLDNESGSRARSIVAAINSRFPPGSHGQTARGRSAGSIALSVPPQYAERPADFLELIAHLPIDQANLDAFAQSYVRVMKNEPAMAEAMMWCLRAIGERSLPFVRELYDEPDIVPRMAALNVGAWLGDPRVVDPLLRLANTGPTPIRIEAIGLLKTVQGGPTLELALRGLLSERDLTVRVAAYETLAARAERVQLARVTERNPSLKVVTDAGTFEPTVSRVLSGTTIHGVERRVIGEKFALDRVRGGEPLVYVTQQRAPRVVVFGDGPVVTEGAFASIWSDRLMLVKDSPASDPRIYYQDYRSTRVVQTTVPTELPELIEFFGRRPSPQDPRPGLDLTYSEIVGALYGLQTAGAINTAFATERDKLMAQLLDANQRALVEERPETASDASETVFFEAPQTRPVDSAPSGPAPAPRPIPIQTTPARPK